MTYGRNPIHTIVQDTMKNFWGLPEISEGKKLGCFDDLIFLELVCEVKCLMSGC